MSLPKIVTEANIQAIIDASTEFDSLETPTSELCQPFAPGALTGIRNRARSAIDNPATKTIAAEQADLKATALRQQHLRVIANKYKIAADQPDLDRWEDYTGDCTSEPFTADPAPFLALASVVWGAQHHR